METINCQKVIKNYIDSKMKKNIAMVSNSEMALLSGYGVKKFKAMYAPDTYARQFRQWRANRVLEEIGVMNKDEIYYEVKRANIKSPEHHYIIKRIKTK